MKKILLGFIMLGGLFVTSCKNHTPLYVTQRDIMYKENDDKSSEKTEQYTLEYIKIK